MSQRRSAVLPGVVVICALFAGRFPAGAEDAVPVLDTASFWRSHYTLQVPVVQKGGTVERMSLEFWQNRAKWIEYDTAPPPTDWAQPDFDDSGWHRAPGVLVASTEKDADRQSAYMALLCMRGKFHVEDPAAASGLTLSVEYRGGIVAYLNGVEIARAHLPATGRPLPFNVLADTTQPEEKGDRRLTDVVVRADLLRRGTNVLALETHRAAHREDEVIWRLQKWPQHVEIPRATCGIERVRLSVSKAGSAAVVPNVTRPGGFQVWNSNVLAADFDLDWGDPNERLAAVRIVAARNGGFSGKVVVGSTGPIRGLDAKMSDLVRVKGPGRIDAGCVQVRWAMPAGGEVGANARYLAIPERFDVLEDAPPADVPVRDKPKAWSRQDRHNPNFNLDSPDVTPVFGAVCPVWVTVNVPKDAQAGDYAGTLTLTATGDEPVRVPVQLALRDWTLPDPDQWHTFAELIQSPETLALGYDVPLWSDEHFKLIERSLRLLSRVGNKTAYLPLICETNQGNAETMVRWIQNPDGTYRHDFSPMDRYLDLVAKVQGRPAVVCVVVWDYFLSRDLKAGSRWEDGDTEQAISALKGHGPEVTLLKAGEAAAKKLELPEYKDPRCAALWKPVADHVVEDIRRRGWQDALSLGILMDLTPTKEDTAGICQIWPELPWVVCRHGELDLKAFPHFGRFKYVTLVWPSQSPYRDPSQGRSCGWKSPPLATQFFRATRDYWPITRFRLMGESCIVRPDCSGFGRMGGDCFGVLKSRREHAYRPAGALPARYPKSSWHNLNIVTSLLARGEKGAVATTRFEMMREGLQECEARVFIERALTDPALREKLGDNLAALCQSTLDERTRSLRRALSTYTESGPYVEHALWNDWVCVPAVVGSAWYTGCADWQGNSEKLYLLAGLVAEKIGRN